MADLSDKEKPTGRAKAGAGKTLKERLDRKSVV